MLSKFGKLYGELRIERNELLFITMAQKSDVRPSFLSAVEAGKKGIKGIPSNWEGKIIEEYDLSDEQIDELRKAIDKSGRY